MKVRVALALALVSAGALSACGSETQAQAVRGWLSQSAFSSNSATLRLDVTHATEALQNESAPTTELTTVCAILNVDTASAAASLPTPQNVGDTELSDAYIELTSATNTCVVASGRPGLHERATAQLALGTRELLLASLQMWVAGHVETDATATRTWASAVAYPSVVRTLTAAITHALTYLARTTSPAADATYCRRHDLAPGVSANLLPTPDAQTTTTLTNALTTLTAAFTGCAMLGGGAATSEPRGPVISQTTARLRHAAADLYFATARVQIASQ